MSLALIQESAKEVRRLAIAGSPLAIGDFRLKKLIAPLEQAGAKIPVFAQVSKAIGDLVNGKEADSAANLLSLSTLLNAILYTQGQSTTEGAYCELEMFASHCTGTRTPARILKPLAQALTTTGSGRLEIVKSAVERGAFNDLRLIDPAIFALGDIYPELADLVAEKVLPGYGPGIMARLKTGLDLKGKKQDARRLEVMHRLDPGGTIALCKTALEEGSAEVKSAAIACLGQHEDCLPLVLEQANAKNKAVRAAALEALARHDRPEVTSLFTELIKGKALDILAGPFRALRNRQALIALLDEGKRVHGLLLKGDSEQLARFAEILDCLKQRKDSESEEFVLGCFAAIEKLGKLKAAKNSLMTGVEILVRLVDLLYKIGSPKTLEAIVVRREILSSSAFDFALWSALRIWPAEKVFDEFSPLLTQSKGAGKDKLASLERFINAHSWDEYSPLNSPIQIEDFDAAEEQALRKVVWDPRWLDAAINADQPTIACSLARPNHKAALAYLLSLGDGKKKAIDAAWIIRALIRCQYPKAADYFLDLVAKKTKGAKQVDYATTRLFDNARYLPAGDLPKLDAFAAKLDEKFVDRFLEALAPLRTCQTASPT